MIQPEIDGRLTAQDAERGLLGVMLMDSQAIEAAEILRPADFSLNSYRRIFTTICRMHAEGSTVDELLLTEELKRTREYEAVGGAVAVAGLTDGMWRVRDVTGYVALIKEKSQLRGIFNLCSVMQSRAMEGEVSSTLLHELQTGAVAQEADGCDLRPTPINELVVPFLAKLSQERAYPGELRGISTGIPDLDVITSGWREGELSYVGALPGRGKTAFMVQVMHAAAKVGTKAGFISLEMTKDQIMRRLATIQTGLHPSRFRNAGTMKDSEWRHTVQQSQGMDGMGDLPIEIFDRSGLRVREIAAVARRMHANGCKIIFVDFVQAIRHEGRDARESINIISAVLRDTCKALQVPFVVASQLARRDSNPNRRPTMQDLRESGNLEQDAHNVLLLYRPQASQDDKRRAGAAV